MVIIRLILITPVRKVVGDVFLGRDYLDPVGVYFQNVCKGSNDFDLICLNKVASCNFKGRCVGQCLGCEGVCCDHFRVAKSVVGHHVDEILSLLFELSQIDICVRVDDVGGILFGIDVN